MNGVLAEGIVGMLLAALAGAFALAFASPADAERSIGHLRARRGAFRLGAFAVAAGMIFTVQADAIVRIAGMEPQDPRFLSARTAGWLLIMAGVALIDGVLWVPSGARKAHIPPADSAP